MMETYQMMRIGFYVCLAVAALFLCISIWLFFRFDIRAILSAKNSKKQAKLVRDMLEENRTTGRFPRRKTTVRRSTGKDGLRKEKAPIPPAERAEPSVFDGPTVRLDAVDSALLVQSATVPEVEDVRFDIVRKTVLRAAEEIIE